MEVLAFFGGGILLATVAYIGLAYIGNRPAQRDAGSYEKSVNIDEKRFNIEKHQAERQEWREDIQEKASGNMALLLARQAQEISSFPADHWGTCEINKSMKRKHIKEQAQLIENTIRQARGEKTGQIEITEADRQRMYG